MTLENRRRNVEREWERVREAWVDFEVLRHAERWDAAVSRLYYCLFYAARALLLSEGLEPRTHEGTSRLLSLHFVRTKKLPSWMSRVFSRLQKYREQADYATEFAFVREDVEGECEVSSNWVDEACRYLVAADMLPKSFLTEA